MGDPEKESSDVFMDMGDYIILACFCVFSLLIGLDGWRAFTKRANWFPGKAFALTGVTVQILVWWTSLRNLLHAKSQTIGVDAMLNLHQIVVNGRVATCVFIGYLLPGMAAPHFRAFVALAISVSAQIGFELYSLHGSKHDTNNLNKKLWHDMQQRDAQISWSKLVDLILFITIIVLGLILGCTVLAGKTVRDLLKRRISAVFSTDKEEEFHLSEVGNERTKSASWDDFEDESFKSWLAARVCQLDYVIARSVLSSATGILVTISVILFILTNIYYNTIGVVGYIFPIASFILVGWVVICWRWLAAHLYFSTQRRSWKRFLYVEDFWAISIVEMIHMYDLKGDRQRSKDYEKPSYRLNGLLTKIFTKLRLHKLLYLVVMLQVTVVFFSNVCELLSEVIIGKFMYWCCKRLSKVDQVALPDKYAIFLESICMPGEDPTDLWQANISSIRRIRSEHQEKDRKCEQINSIFQHYSLKWANDGSQLLDKLKKNSLPSILKHFPSVEKNPWKITVVSLISIIIQLQRAKDRHIVTQVLKLCQEVWNFLSFIDEEDIDLHAYDISPVDDFNRDANPVTMAADKEFYRLQIKYAKLPRDSQECTIDAQITPRILDALLEDSKVLLERENLLNETPQNNQEKKFVADLSDSKDWMEIALSYNLYKLCKVMVDDGVEDYVAWAETSLRNVIAACLSELPDMLVKQCWKWAEGFEEDKLLEAIGLSMKVRGMMEAWMLQPKLVLNPTMKWKWTLQASDQSSVAQGVPH